MPRWLTTLLRLTPTVAGACAVSVVGLFAFRAIVPQSELVSSANTLGNYLQTVGGIYAVLLAFVVYVVWGQYNEARGFVEREATALVDLHRIASGLPRATRTAIQRGLSDYARTVVSDEWQAMANGDETTIERIGERLDQVWTAIHACQPASSCQHTVYGEVLSRYNDLSDIRTNRLIAARARIPVAMKILLYAGAAIIVGSMWMLAFDKVWIHAVVTAALAGAIAHILYLITDLDDAFAGDWQVAKAPYERALRHFERAAHLVDVDAA